MKRKNYFDMEVVEAAANQLRKRHRQYGGIGIGGAAGSMLSKDLEGVFLRRDKTAEEIRAAFKKAAMCLRGGRRNG